MSMTAQDYEMEEFYDRIREELYPDHKQQAIEEFTADRLRSFYLQSPMVMRPAVEAIQESKALLATERNSPALVFSASAYELLLKATLLRPVIYGLVHHDAFAELIVQKVVGRQTNIDRYESLLARLFETLADINISKICRSGSTVPLMKEAKELQGLRDRILHQGIRCTRADAERALSVAIAIYEEIVRPMIWALGLTVGEKGIIEPAV
ncbi:hypothetical protein A1353_21075 [Methylomonas methanica]|uniref:RiboL-PSP-HEPN domain-containing protein n=1 Tax=Methylomonas methanica TaxID=421 RepID=A0A177M0E5_METMH|nr:hypothetical protein [Methylomonas methanica]OAH99110.1 hypothetical protein A1353_21075 [Methylomonas methanica]